MNDVDHKIWSSFRCLDSGQIKQRFDGFVAASKLSFFEIYASYDSWFSALDKLSKQREVVILFEWHERTFFEAAKHGSSGFYSFSQSSYFTSCLNTSYWQYDRDKRWGVLFGWTVHEEVHHFHELLLVHFGLVPDGHDMFLEESEANIFELLFWHWLNHIRRRVDDLNQNLSQTS